MSGTIPGGSRIVLVVSTAVFFSVLNTSIVNVILPTIGRDLDVETGRLGWVVTAYFLVYAVAIPVYGRLADQYGARRFFLVGLSVFAIGSLVCAAAPSFSLLIAARVLQAVGGAAIPGLGLTLASRAYPPDQQGTVIGVVSITLGVASAIGPPLGGLVSDALGWHAVFAVGALAGLLVPFSYRFLPRDEGEGGERLDVWGGLFLGLAVSGGLLSATEGVSGGWSSPLVLISGGVAAAALVALVIRQATAPSPFIPRELLENSRFLTLVATGFATMGASLGTLIGLPLLLISVNGLSPAQVGLALLPNAAATAALGIVAGRVQDHVGSRVPVRAGLALLLIGLFALSSAVGAPAWELSAIIGLVGIGMAFVNTPLAAAVSLVVPRERLASAQSINTMLFFLGGSVSATLLTAIMAARSRADDALNPLHTGLGVPFSDAFLGLAVPLVAALALSVLLPTRAAESDDPAPAVGCELPWASSSSAPLTGVAAGRGRRTDDS